jgi:hypothetical protein
MNYPAIMLKINNAVYKFLVDTGSNKTFIFKPKQSFTEIKFHRKKWIRFKTFLLPAVQKKMLIDFGIIKQHSNILIANWHKFLQYSANLTKNLQIVMFFQQFNYDGILGNDILSKLRIKIDCKKDEADVIRDFEKEEYDVFRLKNYCNHIFAPIFLDNRKKDAIIDTGINVSELVIRKKTSHLKFLTKNYMLLWNVKKLFKIYKFTSGVHFLGRTFNAVKVAVSDLTGKNNPLVCYPFLKKFKVIIFDKNKLLYVLKDGI